MRIAIFAIFCYAAALLVATAHHLFGWIAAAIYVPVLLLAVLLIHFITRERRGEAQAQIAERDNAIVENEDAIVQGYIRRSKYFTATVSIALIHTPSNRVVMCRMKGGEFSGEWGLPGGYVDPGKEEETKNPELKAREEVVKYLGIDPEKVPEGVSLTGEDPIDIYYSNFANVRGLAYEYIFDDQSNVIQGISNRDDCLLVAIAKIPELELDRPIASFAIDVLDRFQKTTLAPDFLGRFEEAKNRKHNKLAELRAKLIKSIIYVKETG